jgi:D-glycero-alpha-D-manno-heptose-7-phosphate kinase
MCDVLESGDLRTLGALLHEAFVAKRQMNPYITTGTPIEAMLDAAGDAGAFGGKVCGAGGGGYLLLAAPPESHAGIRARLEDMGGQFAGFQFRAEGVRATRGSATWAPAT